jgi:hypothetical protein
MKNESNSRYSTSCNRPAWPAIVKRNINLSDSHEFAHVGNPEVGGSHSYTLVGDSVQFLLGWPEAFVVFLRILRSFKTSTFL